MGRQEEADTAQKNLRLGAEKLREVHARSKKRRVNPATDELLRQLENAAGSLGDGVSELVHGTQKPKGRRGRRPLALLTLGGLAAGSRSRSTMKLITALTFEGAIFRLVKAWSITALGVPSPTRPALGRERRRLSPIDPQHEEQGSLKPEAEVA